MNFCRRLIICITCLIFGLSFTFSVTAKKKVLVLNSYNIGYLWTDQQVEGLKAVFDTVYTLEVFIEYMDTRRYLEKSDFEDYFKNLTLKYTSLQVDAVVATDNDALNLLIDFRKGTIFDTIPILFTGISNIEDYDFEKENIYGVYEEPGMSSILESIKDIFPERKKVYVLSDRSTTGKVYKNEFLKNQALYPELELIYFDSLTTKNVREIFDALDKNAVVYSFGITQDTLGNRMLTDGILREIDQHYDFPIYSGTSKYFDNVLGGRFSTGFTHGVECGKMVLEILNNRYPKERIVEPEIHLSYNFQVMQRYNIKRSQLPKGSAVYNKPESLWQRYRVLISIYLTILVFLVVTVVLLIRNNMIQKKYRKTLQIARDNALQSDHLKSAFLANVSHEFRTPLNAIVGFSDLLVEENQNKDLDVYIQLVNRNADLLTQLINDVLDLSVIDAQQLKFDFKTIDLQAVFKSLHKQTSMLLSDGGKGHIELVLSEVAASDVTFITDELRFNQIVMNLLQNSTKYTQNGYVEFGFKVVDEPFLKKKFKDFVLHQKSNGYLYVYVKDTGIGIPETMLDNVFNRFSRVDSKVVKNISGTGLGLSICKSLIEHLGGNISVKSVEGEGSTFFFYLPLNP